MTALAVLEVERAAVAYRFDSLGLPEGCLDRSRFFELQGQGGESFGVYALEVRRRQGWLIAGVGGIPGHDLTEEFLPFIERQLRDAGCDAIFVQTRRPGLIRKLDRCGFLLDSSILTKPL